MKYRNILLVDDDTDDAEIFAAALQTISDKIKYSVENNALEALKKLRDSRLAPDMIFLDYHMPYLDGTEFLKLLRDVKELKNIPVVLYSGHSGALLKDAVDKFKKVQFLKKHGNFKKLIELLKEIIKAEVSAKE